MLKFLAGVVVGGAVAGVAGLIGGAMAGALYGSQRVAWALSLTEEEVDNLDPEDREDARHIRGSAREIGQNGYNFVRKEAA